MENLKITFTRPDEDVFTLIPPTFYENSIVGQTELNDLIKELNKTFNDFFSEDIKIDVFTETKHTLIKKQSVELSS
mgnify:CR=1 FL=1